MKQTIRILHLEDNSNDAELAQSILAAEGIICQTIVAGNRDEFVKALDQNGFDLVIADYNLPDFDGLSALAMTRAKYPDCPFIFLSGTIGEDIAIESLKNGATDYVLKQRISRLAPAVQRALKEQEDRFARKEAEENLRKLSQAVEQSPVSIVITNLKGEIEYVNPKFTQITGYSREEVLGQNPRVLKTGETSPEEYKRLWDTITSGNTWQGEFHNKRKDGELFWEAATISPIKSKAGEITNFIAVKEDITERKSLERQIRQALKMEAIGTLAGGIAHDFNNLLTAIIGFGTLLEMRMHPDDPLRKNATHILSAADRAASLTKSLLTFSREQPLDTKIVDLSYIIRNIEKLLPQILREDIECRLLLSEEELAIFADQGQIDQILLNLATNARDAMPNGGELTISTMLMAMDQKFINAHGFGKTGNYAVLSVTDTGMGMDEAIRQRIFEPFFTTKEVGKGTGLGLSIIFGIVKQHNGFISCYSEPGIGTTFNIYLPLHQGKFDQDIVQDSIKPAGGTETILLAEDDDMVRHLTRLILEGAGYRVVEAVNGSNAVQQYMDHRNEVALLILDLIMPKKNGRDAYNAIREENPHVRVIFTSGYSADVANIQELSADGFDFIAKPVRPTDLLEKVREVLDRSK